MTSAVAKAAFERGDYELALKRANDAKVTLALETVGRFSLISFLRDYWVELLVIVVLLGVFVYITILSFIYFIIKAFKISLDLP